MLAKQYIEKFGFDTTKAFLQATVSDKVIGNLCVYKCDKCGCILNSKGLLYLHKKNHSHHSVSSSNECLIKSFLHICKLCDKSVLCDQQTFSQHFRHNHNISLGEYCKRTGCILTKHDNVTQSFLKSLKESQTPDNLCIFSCNLCNSEQNRFFAFKKHLKSHKESTIQSIPSYLVQGFSYKCKKCDKLVLCDLGAIQRHLKKAHCENNNFESLLMQRKYKIFCDSFIGKIPVSTRMWQNKTLSISKIPIKEVTSIFGNLCTFTCPKCNNDYQSYLTMVRHCKKSHSHHIKYDFSLVSVARSHACLVCPTVILSDRTFILHHLNKRHKMSLTEYERIFKRNGGKTLPSYNDWIKSGCPDISL